MSTFQFVLLCVGAFIVLTSFDLTPIWNGLKGLVSRAKLPDVPSFDVSEGDNLIEVVKKWDDLKDACEKNGLTEAVTKLNEIFPVLIKAEKTKETE